MVSSPDTGWISCLTCSPSEERTRGVGLPWPIRHGGVTDRQPYDRHRDDRLSAMPPLSRSGRYPPPHSRAARGRVVPAPACPPMPSTSTPSGPIWLRSLGGRPPDRTTPATDPRPLPCPAAAGLFVSGECLAEGPARHCRPGCMRLSMPSPMPVGKDTSPGRKCTTSANSSPSPAKASAPARQGRVRLLGG
jgi:hypothetical protein